MPTTEIHEIPARQIKKGDRFASKRNGLEVVVVAVSHGTTRTTVEYTSPDPEDIETSKTGWPQDELVKVFREVPTAEEIAERDAERRAFYEARLLETLHNAPHDITAIRAKVAAEVARLGVVEVACRQVGVAEEAVATELAMWGARWFFSPTCRENYGNSVAAFIVARVDSLKEELLRGADDTWSGRGNDAKRAKWDALRDLATGSGTHGYTISTAKHVANGDI